MPQLKLSVSGMSSKQDGDRLVEQTSGVAGVRFVNANHEEGYVVITHGDGFDVEDEDVMNHGGSGEVIHAILNRRKRRSRRSLRCEFYFSG